MIKPETFLSLPPHQQMKYQTEYQQEYAGLYEEVQKSAGEQSKVLQQQNIVQTGIHENNMVMKELNSLGDEGIVYKMVGPTLLKEDLSEAKDTVNKRIKHFTGQMEMLAKNMKEQRDAIMKKKKRMDEIDKTFRDIKMLSIKKQQMEYQKLQRQQQEQMKKQNNKKNKKKK